MIVDELYVLIATHGRSERLAITLDSIALATRPPVPFQVIVVENGSDEGARSVCDQARDGLSITYLHVSEPGKSHALNYAIQRYVRGGLIVFFDDDIRVAKETLITYYESTKKHGPDCYFGGPVSIDYEEPPPKWLLKYLPASARGWEMSSETCMATGEIFLGANYAVHYQNVTEVGSFNERVGPGSWIKGTDKNPVGQETDFQRRLQSRNVTPIYLHGARVWHFVPRSRCSEDWALHRLYRNSLTVALRERPEERCLMLCGVPLRLLKMYVVAKLRSYASKFVKNRHRAFELRRRLYAVRGAIDAVKGVGRIKNH